MQLSCILGYNSGDVPYGRLKKPLARPTHHLPLQCRPTYSAGLRAALPDVYTHALVEGLPD